jgi:glutamyl/glutaminyl-tRNA synthetase
MIFRRFFSSEVRVRFAPSPTGKIHLGGLRTAFYNYLFAKKFDGKFILRIEDTDQDRLQKDSVSNIIESLKWTNLLPDYGPGFSDNASDYIQSNRLKYYNDHIQVLLDAKVAYKCFCDTNRLELLRRNAVKNQERISYDGKCRLLSENTLKENELAGKPYVVRFKVG